MNVSLFVTCLTENFYPRQVIAMVKVLEHLGCRIDFPPGQTCCGQPMYNNGFHDEAQRLAVRMTRLFAHSEWIVTPSGSCAAMVHEYFPELLRSAGVGESEAAALVRKTREFCDFLVNVLKVDLRALGVRAAGRATYHYSCHLRGIGISDEPTRLIEQIAGLEFTPLDNPEQCCGFGGTFASKYPDISGAMVRDKVASIRATGAATVISNEAGCTMNIAGACRRAGLRPEFKSLAEVIAEGLGRMNAGPSET